MRFQRHGWLDPCRSQHAAAGLGANVTYNLMNYGFMWFYMVLYVLLWFYHVFNGFIRFYDRYIMIHLVAMVLINIYKPT